MLFKHTSASPSNLVNETDEETKDKSSLLGDGANRRHEQHWENWAKILLV